MKNIPYILGALILLIILHFSGLLNSYNLTHPIWRTNATMFGSLIGVVIAVLLFWLSNSKPDIAQKLLIMIGVIFVICLGATLYYANVFIDAAEYDRIAVQIWHKGSYSVFATFVPLVAYLLRMILGKA